MKPVIRYILIVGEVLVALAMLVASGVIMAVGPLLAGIPCVMLAFAAGFFAFRDVKALVDPVRKADQPMVHVGDNYKYTIYINGIEYSIDDDTITLEDIIELRYGEKANKKCFSIIWTSSSGGRGNIKSSNPLVNVRVGVVDGMLFTLVVADENESEAEVEGK